MNEDDFLNFADATDIDILKHKESHFGGSFPIMLEYYQNEGKGISPEFDLARIEDLAAEELRIGGNLAAQVLAPKDIEDIKRAKEAYQHLRDLYEIKHPKNLIPILIANLILSEEEVPEKEIDAIVAKKTEIVPALVSLLKNEDMYDPLFPGYGKAPHLAALCLGKIGDKRGIISLFEALGKGDFFDDEINTSALHAIGEPAKEFLVKVLRGKPITEDNEKAAIALIPFKEDTDVARTAFEMLKSINLKVDSALAVYLILLSEHLDDSLKPDFENFSFPKELKTDVNAILKLWKTAP